MEQVLPIQVEAVVSVAKPEVGAAEAEREALQVQARKVFVYVRSAVQKYRINEHRSAVRLSVRNVTRLWTESNKIERGWKKCQEEMERVQWDVERLMAET